MHSDKIKYSIKYKLFMLSATVAVPFLIMVVYLIYALHNYSNAYDTIVSNMTVANNYNLNFKEEMDESLYKLVVGSVTFETVGEEEGLQNPYDMIADLRSEFGNLMTITTDGESRACVLAHERAHIRRRDHWVKPAAYLLLAVYWFQPLVWIAVVAV